MGFTLRKRLEKSARLRLLRIPEEYL